MPAAVGAAIYVLHGAEKAVNLHENAGFALATLGRWRYDDSTMYTWMCLMLARDRGDRMAVGRG